MPRATGLWMGITAIATGALIPVAPPAIRWILRIGFVVVDALAIMRGYRRAYSQHWPVFALSCLNSYLRQTDI